jgi:1,2-diacylglycerol 3-alpha-glucosyltransferase
MVIGIVSTWFERGAGVVSRQYLRALTPDHEVHVYARGGERYARGVEEWDGDHVTWGRKSLVQVNGTPIVESDFRRWIRDKGIEVILFNEQQWWPPVLWAKDMGVRVGTYVDYYTHETVPLFEAYDFLVCNTSRHFEAFSWHDGARYVPWGTDLSLFRPSDKRPRDADHVVFFHSSGYNPHRKGLGPLLIAFDRLGRDAPAHLLVHTQVPLTRALPDHVELIQRLQGAGRLEVIQATVPAPGLYHLGDVYCYPSRLDGIGLTVAEAIACGLPAVVPDHPPMNEFVEPGRSGRLVEVTALRERADGYYWPECEVDVDDLTDALEAFVGDRDRLTAMKRDARAFAEERLDWEDRRETLVELFTRVRSRSLTEEIRSAIHDYEAARRARFPWLRLPRVWYRTLRR